jgi:predicted nucleic acid-binding Zn ribbon protein
MPRPQPSPAPKDHAQGVRTPEGAISARLCPVCRQLPLKGNQTVCSGKCRIARSRQRKAEALAARDRDIERHLQAALRLLRVNYQTRGTLTLKAYGRYSFRRGTGR